VVLTGALAGGLNALLVTRLRLPALIVTLGSFSLFRGLAEGITRSTDNFTGFPAAFLALGQHDLLGFVPAAFPVFAAVAAALWLLVHRTAVGRSFFAIGHSPEGARHAGIPVERRLALAYVTSGACSALAAGVYVAANGQAKADAALGYELVAVTAVVLGGTSIFGGRGSVHGTLLGLFALVVLRIGLQLSDLPGELADILTGVLLPAAIGANRVLSRKGT
jgi:rhamnose transport system permease protein